jgi:glycosyltransferase involved in cell wall biosynthesis
MRKIRLLCLISKLTGGGAERMMIYLLRGLDRDRFDITLGLGRAEGPFLPMVPGDVRVLDFDVDRDAHAVDDLARLFRRGEHDLSFSMIAMNLAAVVAREMSGSRIPLILGARNHYSRAFPAEAQNAELKMLAVRLLYPRAERIIGVAQGVCDDLIANFGVPPERVRAILNPIDLERVRRAAQEPPPHPWLQPGADRPTLVTVGKLQVAKGHHDLLAAFARVRAELPARLLILGQGPLEAELRATIARHQLQDDVALVGFQSNPYAFMGHSPIFVLSSLWEGFPNVLTEAMACGAAVISTDCPSGPSEIIEDGRSGLLVPVGDAGALSDAMLRLLRDESLRRAIAARGHREVERFSVEKIIAQYAASFEEVLRGAQERIAS